MGARVRFPGGSIALLFAELNVPWFDPVAIHLGPIELRWYGLAYLAGFLVGGWVLDRLCRDGFLPLDKDSISDLIGILVLGVLVGGRLGYALFYERGMLLHPVELVRVWTGGLSFHGGLIGCTLGTVWLARRKKVAWFRLADAMVLAAPFGIFFVRCTNFINAELYGRIAPAWLPWGVRFPTDPLARALVPDLARGGSLHWYAPWRRLHESGEWDRLLPNLPLRHPSQLYEALLEGVLIGVVLWTVYRRRESLAPGTLAVLFLALYALARFVVEFFRQPDAQLGFVLGPLSMGQLLSLGVAGAAAVAYAIARRASAAGRPMPETPVE